MTGNDPLKPFVVAVVGPTTAGKSEAAVALCRILGGEAVSIDAMQVYQGMRIGTARMSADEMKNVPHHMIAVAPPDEPWSVADYCRHALPVIEDILSRRALPVLVGGTGLYLEALRRPLTFASAAPDERLRAELGALSSAELREKLAAVDPAAASRLPHGDRRRMIRALEIRHTTGQAMSNRADESDERFDLCTLGLIMPRELLVERIKTRTERMFVDGLAGEVAFLLEMGVDAGAQSMQAIGYKETARMLRGEITNSEAIEAVFVATRQYAKRQMTWFRKTPGILWFDRTAYPDVPACYGAMAGAVLTRMWTRGEKSNETG